MAGVTLVQGMAPQWELSIVSSKVIHREVERDLIPRTIAIVELDEGPWVYTWIDGEIPTQSHRPIRVEYRPVPTADQLPVFSILSAFPG
ncbi:OB-fold domain-containing protein [Rhodococcus marinonascens]|uniref:OB-fold domain-containing protein n=1 Tax=Rhodococcus marinonascens TaxID=38311 RepID=UPI001FE705CC|nr:OB-fold domain-containing protein [Rhodococcus marinonascens]